MGNAATVSIAPPEAAGSAGERIVLPGQAPDGQHILAVLLKRSYTIVPNQLCRRAPKDRKLVAADTHFGDPMNSTVRYESDFVPFKTATDVVLYCDADDGAGCEPGGDRGDKGYAGWQDEAACESADSGTGVDR